MEQTIITAQSYILADGETAVHGEFACIDATGFASPAAVGAGLRCVGVFDLAATGGLDVVGDGVKKVRIRFGQPMETFACKSDTTDAVTLVGSTAYLFDGTTVSSNGTGTSEAGTVVKIDDSTTPATVFVKPTGF